MQNALYKKLALAFLMSHLNSFKAWYQCHSPFQKFCFFVYNKQSFVILPQSCILKILITCKVKKQWALDFPRERIITVYDLNRSVLDSFIDVTKPMKMNISTKTFWNIYLETSKCWIAILISFIIAWKSLLLLFLFYIIGQKIQLTLSLIDLMLWKRSILKFLIRY